MALQLRRDSLAWLKHFYLSGAQMIYLTFCYCKYNDIMRLQIVAQRT